MIAEHRAKSGGKRLPSRSREETFGKRTAGAGEDRAEDTITEAEPPRQEYQPFNADEEEAYWESAHADQPYAGADDFERYAAAYRTGYEGFNRLGAEYSFDDVEEDLQEEYEAEGSPVPWERAREASRAAWDRLEEQRSAAESESSAPVN